MITSRYIRVQVKETHEEQVFSTIAEAKKWCAKVAKTFGETMHFEIISVTERTKTWEVKHG